MRLDDDIQTPRSNEAVRAWERQAELVHDLGDADGGGAGDADAAVDEGCRAVFAASFFDSRTISTNVLAD